MAVVSSTRKPVLGAGAVGLILAAAVAAATIVWTVRCALVCSKPTGAIMPSLNSSATSLAQQQVHSSGDCSSCSFLNGVANINSIFRIRFSTQSSTSNSTKVQEQMDVGQLDHPTDKLEEQCQQLQEKDHQLQQSRQQNLRQQVNEQFHKAARYASPIAHGKNYQQILNTVSLPSWEAKLLQPATRDCKKGAWADLGVGSWYTTADGEFLYEPSSCKLRRLTADAARLCLANKTITFVGDSLSRYQYLNLAYFLSHGQYMQRYADDGKLSLAREHMWGNFTHFYKEGSKLLQHQSLTVNATEVCHCHRINLDATTREDRTLVVSARASAAAAAAAAAAGQVSTNGTALNFKVAYRQAIGMKSTVVNETLEAIQMARQDFMEADNFIIVNIGHWFHWNMASPTDSYQAVAAAYEQVFQGAADAAPGGGQVPLKLLWKTTTAEQGPPKHPRAWHRLLTAMAQHHGWSVMDAHMVTDSMVQAGLQGFWDSLHFHDFVYDQLNDVLLNGLC